jgi:oligosaccharide reducing-end xylanase
MLGKTPHEITARLDSTYHRLFFGDNETQRVYYPFGADRAYIMDVANNDVRTEGMSYGMMIAVQLDKKEVFDRLWTWAVTHMKFTSGPHAGYFAWHCKTDGTVLDSTAASDGEEWFTMSLLFASARWGNGTGIFNYRAQALDILHSMLHKQSELDHGRVTDMFDTEHKLVRFVPSAGGDRFTDPSYQLPHFYELWARWSDVDNAFWCDAAGASRLLLRRACHQSTGLAPDYSEFDGRPMSSDPGGHGDFRFDAWRVAMNIAMDWVWFARDTFEVAQSNRLLTFFHDAQINKYGNQFSLDGKQLSDDHSTGLVAANAVAALAATIPGRRDFVEALWDATTPSGYYRYYDGMLYLLGMLELSGNFRIYDPMGGSFPACKE